MTRESSIAKIYLHMERSPYEPFCTIKDGKENYVYTRNRVRDIFNVAEYTGESFAKAPIARNADLSIINFVMNQKTFKGYIGALFELIAYVDKTLRTTGLID